MLAPTYLYLSVSLKYIPVPVQFIPRTIILPAPVTFGLKIEKFICICEIRLLKFAYCEAGSAAENKRNNYVFPITKTSLET